MNMVNIVWDMKYIMKFTILQTGSLNVIIIRDKHKINNEHCKYK